MAAPGRPYQGQTTSVLTAEDPAGRARRNGISPPPPPPPTLKGAVKVDGFPDRCKYPFAEIATDGGVWKLDPAEYQAKPGTIRSAASKWATEHSIPVKTVVDGGFVYIQFTPRQPRPATTPTSASATVHWTRPGAQVAVCGVIDRATGAPAGSLTGDRAKVTCQRCKHTGTWRAGS